VDRDSVISMVRRLVGIALALLVAAAPAVADVCAANCAEHASHSVHASAVPTDGVQHASHHHHHSVADAATPMTTVGMRGVPHACASADTLATQSRESVRVGLEKLSALVASIVVPPPAAMPRATPMVDGRHGPPGPVRTIAPLRI